MWASVKTESGINGEKMQTVY